MVNRVWTYSQKSGIIYKNCLPVGVGYSGSSYGLNNPEKQHVQKIGPIPRGVWKIISWYDKTDKFGPIVARLEPSNKEMALGRSGFLIHGDNSKGDKSASSGCIILNRNLREAIKNSKETEIAVIL